MDHNPKNVYSLKSVNRARILECIRRQPTSRIEISRQTGLTKSAVTMLTNDMISEGLLYELGLSEKSTTPGRTSILLDIVADYAYAIGVTLHRRKIGVCISDLKLNCIAKENCETTLFNTPNEAVNWICSAINRISFEANISLSKCIGIGISSPGPLDYTNGVILEPPHFPLFHHYPIVEKMKQHFDFPVFLENNSVSLALTNFYVRGKSNRNELFVVIADGIGSALLQDGIVFRGSRGFAGELGHVSVNPKGEYCSCGNRGCLELYATLQSLKKRFKFESYEDVMDKAISGDQDNLKIMNYLVENLGSALTASVNLFDLETITIFSEYSYHIDWLTKQLEKYIQKHSLIHHVHPISVLASKITLSEIDVASSVSAINYFFKHNNQRKHPSF
jgi:predicted NBD/HSP70 family sugar kinase